MHELSLCLELIRVIEDHARRQSFHRVRLVRLEVGALAGIEIEALRFGFTAATQGTLAEAAVLEIEQPPGLAGCLDCGAVMEICGGEMRIIAFITEAVDVRAILEHLGEPATPPRIASARGPPEGYEDAAEEAIDAEECLLGDPLAQPEPEYEYDQRVSW
jgi:hydrogenase nickel insertion protein HypA